MPVEHLAILAPGLLGASVARAARAREAARHITLWARRPETRLALAAQPWCDLAADTPEAAVAAASLVVVAAPVDRIIELTARIAPRLPAGAIVTDVGSVKAAICREGRAALPAGTHFVGSHPMAGGALTGWENASDQLFENRPCFVTPLPDTDPAATDAVARFWHALGSEVVTVEPDRHDEIVAHISHLPQSVATCLGTFLATRDPGWRHLAGGGLRDTTRIAASDATMWIEIFRQNRDELLRALGAYEDELHAFRSALANRDWPELRARLERGKSWRDGFRP